MSVILTCLILSSDWSVAAAGVGEHAGRVRRQQRDGHTHRYRQQQLPRRPSSRQEGAER